jgi:hypothetical protein
MFVAEASVQAYLVQRINIGFCDRLPRIASAIRSRRIVRGEVTEADNGCNGDHDIIDTVYTPANPCSQTSGLYHRKLPVSFVSDDARYIAIIYQ